MISPTFTLTEQFELGGSYYSWRLKDSQIRFRGAGVYEKLVLNRIPADKECIASFYDALNLLDVWNWRNDYDPHDVGVAVLDGSSWTFSASFDGKECQSEGWNGYPSYYDVSLTKIDRGRFALLVTAMHDCFGIEAYISQAKGHAELELQNRTLRDSQS